MSNFDRLSQAGLISADMAPASLEQVNALPASVVDHLLSLKSLGMGSLGSQGPSAHSWVVL